MSSENPVADRLLSDARKKTARQESDMLAKAALAVGIVGLLVAGFIPLFGWILGAVAGGMSIPGMRRPVSAKIARIALVIGVGAILVATFFFTLAIS